MKAIKKILIALLSVCMLCAFSLAFVACTKDNNPPTNNDYSVTFMLEGEQYGQVQTVKKGRRIQKPTDPTFSTEGYVFTGWYTSEAFEENTLWNFNTGIVTSDLTLYAGYRVVSGNVTELAKANEPITSKLTWTQASVSSANDYQVIITDKSGAEKTLTGTVEFDAENFKVTFTPTTIPQGGIYSISVKDTTKTQEACVVENVLLCGEGTVTNPYLIGTALDFEAVNKANVSQGVNFSLFKNITVEAIRSEQCDFVFNGVLNGNGKKIALENSNCGAIYKVGANGYIYNVGVEGKVSTSSFDSIGALVDYNLGRVEKIRSTANVENTGGTTGANGLANALDSALEDGAGRRGIAGGIVGTNLANAVVYNCTVSSSSSSTGTVKASIAGGVIVGLNYGKIEACVGDGCFGAWNSKETGKSLSSYSYGGAIVGINDGQVLKCSVSGSGKVLAQRYTNEADALNAVGTNNANIGGIAGYNMANGTISQCYFSGVRVHGDENVGGIAGLNAGAISDCYVEGVLQSTNMLVYIGGRTNVGGIVGKLETTGTVTNCYSTANVFAYGENAVAYALAEKASNSLYVTANPNTKSLNDNADTNPTPATIIAPTGDSNVAINVEGGSFNGTTNNMVIAQSNLITINGNNAFYFNDTTIKLIFETEAIPEETIEVDLFEADGTEFKTVTVAETGAAIAGPVVKGYKFVGWTTELNGEVVFPANSTISLYDVIDYKDNYGAIKLYAVMEERLPNEGLIVGVYYRYVDKVVAGATQAIEDAFKAWMQTKGYTYSVEFRVYEGDSLTVANFGSAVNADGDIDVILGAGSNIYSTGKVEFITRAYMTYDGLTDRYAVLLTDTERAMDFYSFVTGLGNGSAEITFMVEGSPVVKNVSELLGDKVNVPTVTVPAGYEFIGWATTENATEAQVTASSIGYADVQALLSEGKVTLYPVCVEKQADLVVYIHLSASKSTYITDAEADAIEAAFATLMPNKVVQFVRITGKNAAGFQEEIASVANVDVYIGGNSADNVTFDSEYGKTAAGSGHFENTSRKVGIIAGCANRELAIVLYNYLTTAKA